MNLRFSAIILLLVFFGCTESSTQHLSGRLTFRPIGVEQIYLYEKIGNRLFAIDSAVIDEEGAFFFSKDRYAKGYYQLALSDSSKVDIILNPSEPEVKLEFDDPRLHYGIHVISSTENQILWKYKLVSKSVHEKLANLEHQFSDLDSSGISKVQLNYRKDSLLQYKRHYRNELGSQHPNTFFAKVVRATAQPEVSNKAEIKTRFFENIDFSDAELIRSTVFSVAIMRFLQDHTEFTEIGFRSSIDTVLQLAKMNSEVYSFCLEYLLEVFDKIGPEIIFQYLVEEYVIGEGCSEANISQLMQDKAGVYARLVPGKIAPGASLTDKNGIFKELEKEVATTKISLLFFWSSSCHFCEEAIPQIKDLFNSNKLSGMQVIAISLDESEEDWLKVIEENTLGWTNLSELKGWKSSIVELYHIRRTPSYYLLDRDMKILWRPRTADELKKGIAEYW